MFRLSVYTIMVMICLALTLPNHSLFQAGATQVNTLKGLKDIGIGVRVDSIDADASSDGLNRDKLLKFVTQKLKKSGIKVLTDLELGTVKGQPKLVVNINTDKQPGPIYIFTVALDFTQIVILSRNPGLTAVSPTWTVLTTGGALPEDLSKNVESALGPMLDNFVSDYKQANP